MQASGIRVCGLLLVVVFHLGVDSCVTEWNFEKLRQLLKDDNTNEFRKEAEMRRGEKPPSLQDLTEMLNEIDSGIVPQYVEDEFTLIGSHKVNFSYSNGNIGNANATQYGSFRMNNDMLTYSTLEFHYIPGKFGSYDYEAGASFYTHLKYTKGDSYVNFQGSVLGALQLKIPNGKYVANGNYTGITQGNFMQFDGSLMQRVNSLGILHTSLYYSVNDITINGKVEESKFWNTVDIRSMTGGTNTTVKMYGRMPADNCTLISHGEGNLTNVDKSATLQATSIIESCAFSDMSDLLSEESLKYLFSIPRVGADVYLP